MTPLHLAVSSGNTKIMHKLIVRGANKNIRNVKGKSPKDTA